MSTTIREEVILWPTIVATLITVIAAVIGYITSAHDWDMVLANACFVGTAVAWFVVIDRLRQLHDAHARSEGQILILSAIQHRRVTEYRSVVAEAERLLGHDGA